MDGTSIRKYYSTEVDALLKSYKEFSILIPACDGQGNSLQGKGSGSSSNAEDGRFVESLIRSYLQKFLPSELEVATGFILRPAVKCGTDDKNRKVGTDKHSTQLDILIYDKAHYPAFMRFENNVVVPPECVVAIISVKKTLEKRDLKKEILCLSHAAKLCRHSREIVASCIVEKGINKRKDKNVRGPFLAIVAPDTNIAKPQTAFKAIIEAYKEDNSLYFDETVGYVGALRRWSVFKRRPQRPNKNLAEYISMRNKSKDKDRLHIGFQLILTGILSVYYDPTRSSIKRPGFTAFKSGEKHDDELGSIQVIGLRKEDSLYPDDEYKHIYELIHQRREQKANG